MPENIIYYDGDCGLCHSAVKFLLKIDSKNKFFFSPLSTLNENKKKVDSIILAIDNNFFYEGRAIIKILENIDNNWYYFGEILKFIPEELLNIIYRWISRNRKKIFSKKTKECPVIPNYHKDRFILK